MRGWLWLMDGVLLDWIEHKDRSADEVADGLVDALTGLVESAA